MRLTLTRQTRQVLVLMIVVMAVGGWGCEEGGAVSNTSVATQAARQVAAPEKDGPLRLAPPSRWKHLNPEGPALYSPRVSPDGRWVAAAGLGGVGLFVADLGNREPLALVDGERRGPFGWTAAPLGLYFGADQAPLRPWRPGQGAASSRGVAEPRPGVVRPWEVPWDDELGEAIYQGEAGTWWHHPRKGTVTWQETGQDARTVAEYDAWGARASPDGRFVAYCTGRLAESWLWVHHRRVGVTRELGPGVHPAWLPGRDALVYSVPAGVERWQGMSNVTGSELWLFDARTGDHRALTATTDLAEMEPEVTPSGDAVLFVDWRGGGLWRAALLGGGQP